MDNQTRIQYLKIILYIIGVMALGMLTLNQFFNWVYTIQLVSSPCQLCEQTNDYVCSPKINLINYNKLEGLNISLKP